MQKLIHIFNQLGKPKILKAVLFERITA